jgi:uncharacterized protein (UPF0261 family)
MAKTILLISTMNTKAEETLYLRRRIEARRVDVKIMDLSMGGVSRGRSEITAGQVARAGGSSITAVRASRERAKITAIMTAGAIKIASRLWAKGEIQAVVGLGGSTGSLMATDVMRALPFGAPKLMVSSTAALPGMATRYIDTGDLLLFHTVVEIAGLSPLLQNVLDRAAEAAVGLARVAPPSPEAVKAKGTRQVAMSMFGPCESLGQMVRAKLEKAGFAVIGFSAAGVCDRAMEDMIARKYFVGVVDLAPGAVGEFIMGGMRAAGPHRLEAAGRLGIPQVITPSGVNLMSPRKSRYKPDYHTRRKYDLDKLRTFLRLNTDELARVAEVFGEKLNQAQGPVKFLIPTRGWASIDRDGTAVYAPEEDKVFTNRLRELVGPHVEVREVEANLEDKVFADQVAEAFLSMFNPDYS